MAAAAGITAERRSSQAELSRARDAATAAAVVAALAVVAFIVGLVRGETAHERRILAAVGSTRRQQRGLGAATAGVLAGLAALTGTAVAYLTMAAQLGSAVGRLWPIPLVHLGLVVVGVPATAALGSWLLAGGVRSMPSSASS